MITITKYTGRIILLSQTKRCTNTFDRFLEVQKYKKRLSKLVLFTDKKEKKSKKGSNRRGEEEEKGIQQRSL